MIIPRKYWKYLAVWVVVMCSLLIVAFLELPDGKMHLFFLDVGQGDSILIQTPEGHNVLIDGGPRSKVLEELTETLPFFNKKIDFMVLTHPHSDHLEGLVDVIKRYEVGVILITGVQYSNHYYKEFLNDLYVLDESGEIDLFVAQADLDFRVGSLFFDTIYPIYSLAGKSVSNLNNSSIAMRVLYQDPDGKLNKILLTGDCEVEIEEEILESGFEISADIFKAGHHGSKTANSYEFVREVSPSVAVIQCGEANKFGHPHAEVLKIFYQIGIHEVYRNDLDGRVEFVF